MHDSIHSILSYNNMYVSLRLGNSDLGFVQEIAHGYMSTTKQIMILPTILVIMWFVFMKERWTNTCLICLSWGITDNILGPLEHTAHLA